MLDRLAQAQRSGRYPRAWPRRLRTWAGRRERVTYHASATLIEFATPRGPGARPCRLARRRAGAPVRISDRLLLVEDESSIPFQRFRLAGSRDYRRPPRPASRSSPTA